MKRYCALVLAALLAIGHAAGALAEMTQEETDALLIEALFNAAAGTALQDERDALEGLSDEEQTARQEEWAAYRTFTRVWLTAALAQESDEAVKAPEQAEEAEEAETDETEPTCEEAFERLRENALGQAYIAMLSGEDWQSCLEETRIVAARWLEGINAEQLSAMNGDYACWLYAPDTPIDYPVVQGEDNSYYLHRLFNGEHNACGTLFIDYRNLSDFQDPNTLIYGHHMRNGSMFKAITYYAEQSYFDSHPYMLIATPEKLYLVELLAGYTTSKDDHCYDIAISDEEDMQAFVSEACAKSNFQAGLEILPGDRLVTLSTCAYAFENARYIAIGRLTAVEPVPGDDQLPDEQGGEAADEG